ncbi:MAG: hypothetical protein N3A02_00160 [Rectinema sp.]|nr:hypothetical protein [Rectinema sp.]
MNPMSEATVPQCAKREKDLLERAIAAYRMLRTQDAQEPPQDLLEMVAPFAENPDQNFRVLLSVQTAEGASLLEALIPVLARCVVEGRAAAMPQLACHALQKSPYFPLLGRMRSAIDEALMRMPAPQIRAHGVVHALLWDQETSRMAVETPEFDRYIELLERAFATPSEARIWAMQQPPIADGLRQVLQRQPSPDTLRAHLWRLYICPDEQGHQNFCRILSKLQCFPPKEYPALMTRVRELLPDASHPLRAQYRCALMESSRWLDDEVVGALTSVREIQQVFTPEDLRCVWEQTENMYEIFRDITAQRTSPSRYIWTWNWDASSAVRWSKEYLFGLRIVSRLLNAHSKPRRPGILLDALARQDAYGQKICQWFVDLLGRERLMTSLTMLLLLSPAHSTTAAQALQPLSSSATRE